MVRTQPRVPPAAASGESEEKVSAPAHSRVTHPQVMWGLNLTLANVSPESGAGSALSSDGDAACREACSSLNLQVLPPQLQIKAMCRNFGVPVCLLLFSPGATYIPLIVQHSRDREDSHLLGGSEPPRGLGTAGDMRTGRWQL